MISVNLRMKTRYILATLIMCALVLVLFGSGSKACAAQDNTPSSSWSEDDWSSYKGKVKAALPSGKLAVYVSLDNAPISGYKVYQSSGYYSEDINEYGKKISELSGFPGVFMLDESIIDDCNCVRIYEENETNGTKYVSSAWAYKSDFGDDRFMKVELYTISFEQGDIPCRALPETFIMNAEYGLDVVIDTEFGREPGYKLDGYYLMHWADKDGNEVYNVNSPVVLHPVYCTEVEAAENEYDISSGYYLGYETKKGEAVKASTVDQLRNALEDDKLTYVKITGDITINSKSKGNSTYLYPEGREGVFSADGDTIVVQKGVTFTVDGATFNCEYGYGARSKFIIEDGGTLKIKNDGFLKYFNLVVMPGGSLLVDSSYVEHESLHNYGSIKLTNTAGKDGRCIIEGSEQLLYQYNSGNGNFFIAEGATITIDDNAQLQVYGNTYNEYENVNRGTITLNGDGRFTVKGDYSNQNQDRREVTPFVNEGTINICCTPGTDDKYHDGKMLLDDARLLNKGTINVTPKASKWITKETSEFSKNIFIKVDGSQLYNEGTINMNLKDSFGMSVEGLYLEKTSYAAPCDYDIQASIENRKDGVIKAELAKGAHAIYVEQKGLLINDGKITLNGKKNTSKDASLILSGAVENNGTLNGSGSICYYPKGSSGDYSISYKGNKSKLKVKFAYKIENVDKKSNSSIYSKSKVTVDKETYNCGEYNDTIYFLSSGKHKITVDVNGYKKYSGSVKTAKNLKTYLKNSYVPYLTVKLTKSGK